jgi:hypothetical protein
MEWVWQFGLYPLDDERTRLVSRGTERVPSTVVAWLGMRIMEPAAFIMTRRMLLGVKERVAEALRPEPHPSWHAIDHDRKAPTATSQESAATPSPGIV